MSSVYEEMVKEAGIPTTEDEIKAKWAELNEAEEVSIANDEKYSPFWRFLSACVTTPALWLVNFLISFVLPNAFLKDATGTWLKLLAWAVDVEPKEATKTLGTITFVKENAEDEVTIQASTLISSTTIDGKVYRLAVTTEQTIAAGLAFAPIEVEAEFAGKAYNLGAGYYSVLPEPVDGIASVINETDWITSEGTDEESDEALRLRCKNQFSAVGQYHHDAAYRADITLFAGIQTDYVWFEHGGPRGAGSANAYIMIDSGAPSDELVASVNDYIQTQGHHGHGDDLVCYAMPIIPYDLVVTLYHDSYLSAEKITELETEASNIIRYAFRENQDYEGVTRTMPYARFSFSVLADTLHQLCPDLRSVAFNLPDIVTTMGIAGLNSLSVTTEEA